MRVQLLLLTSLLQGHATVFVFSFADVRNKDLMGKQSSNGGAAVAVVFTALVAVSALCIASPQAHELYGQLVDGFLHEELDGIRDFLRQPTWAGLRGGAAEVSFS